MIPLRSIAEFWYDFDGSLLMQIGSVRGLNSSPAKADAGSMAVAAPCVPGPRWGLAKDAQEPPLRVRVSEALPGGMPHALAALGPSANQFGQLSV